ncbi:hypothetical protein GCM10010094_53950 [Streptomyces flaveus]|uniref:Uncharacterized protein n=1 Tax=Streptomyces flaveus TaxID=66370 RepID=A0A917R362_9ACTN|nr:hypothetical protein GCM10010094_53950 [Streptomyces flaveus]
MCCENVVEAGDLPVATGLPLVGRFGLQQWGWEIPNLGRRKAPPKQEHEQLSFGEA